MPSQVLASHYMLLPKVGDIQTIALGLKLDDVIFHWKGMSLILVIDFAYRFVTSFQTVFGTGKLSAKEAFFCYETDWIPDHQHAWQ